MHENLKARSILGLSATLRSIIFIAIIIIIIIAVVVVHHMKTRRLK